MISLIPWRSSTSVPMQRLQRRDRFSALQTELDKAIKDFYNLFEMPGISLENFEELTISPSIDITEDKNSFKIEAEMPGLGEEDISVNIADGQLLIKGEKTLSKQDKDKNYLTREIGYGAYERIIALPERAEIEHAKAIFKKGMLCITVPKKADAEQHSRQIKVEHVADNEKNPAATAQQQTEQEKGVE